MKCSFSLLILFALKSVLSGFNTAILCYSPLYSVYLFSPFYFQLVSFNLGCVSYRKHVVGSCHFIQSDTLCLLDSHLPFCISFPYILFLSICPFISSLIASFPVKYVFFLVYYFNFPVNVF